MSKNKVLNFISKGPSKKNNNLIDSGKIGTLTYEIYDYGDGVGSVHIKKGNLCFHKNKDIFEDEINDFNFDELQNKKEHRINGAGDSDHLVFKYKDGDVDISLKKREYDTIKKLKEKLFGTGD